MNHIPVLTRETIHFLAPKRGENFIDATLGLGGHARLILAKTAPPGRLLGIDQDRETLAAARTKLKKYHARVDFVHANFSEIGLFALKWQKQIDGILLDLGVSTDQLTSDVRGFSFQSDGPLDMRMSPESQRVSASDIVNRWPKDRLKRIFKELGEEPLAGRIASEIAHSRQKTPIEKTSDLVAIIRQAIPAKILFRRQKHFATNVFRALRMVVNDELNCLESALKQSEKILSPGGRLVVISFHSLEDRIVKNFFRESQTLEVLTAKPITPSPAEIQENPRSRSAKLRAVVKK